jgi:hypothetical protein
VWIGIVIGRLSEPSINHRLQFRTPFGDISIKSPRWFCCACEEQPAKSTFSPLVQVLTTHTAPELEFLKSKWAGHLSFGAVADLLHDVLPVNAHLHGETVREHVFATAERLEAELGPEQVHFDDLSQGEIEASADPGAPVTVGLDGGYVRGRDKKAPGAPPVSDNCPRTADTHFGFRPTLAPPMAPQRRTAARCIKNRPQKCASHDSDSILLARQSRITRLGAYWVQAVGRAGHLAFVLNRSA